MSPLAPIAVFAYRRPDHLAKTLSALQRCEGFLDSPLFVYSDGPKSVQADADVRQVRELISTIQHPNLSVFASESNRGLAASIIDGVTNLTNQFGRAIVIEDDIVMRPPALQWLNAGLSRFASDEHVFQITAYQFRVPEFRHRKEGVFLPFTSSWGWATWRRAWRNFDPHVTGSEALFSDRALRNRYNLENSFPMAEHLQSRLQGHHDTWASRWYWAFFNARATAVFPPTSLVDNIGSDETATHNNIGWLKRFLKMPSPYMWDHSHAPVLPSVAADADLAAFRRALRRTGAMRNAHIKSMLRKVGLWNSGT